VSGADAFGEATSETRTKQDVLVRLASPRFMVEGDRARVATIVHNNRASPATFEVSLTGEGATIERLGAKTVKVPANGSKRLDWRIEAKQTGTLRLKAEATSPTGSDAIAKRLPIKPLAVDQWTVATRSVKGRGRLKVTLPDHALPGRGELEVSVSGSPIDAVQQALPYLAKYPYGCVEQTMSRFLPAVAATQALDRLGIENKTLKQRLPALTRAGLQKLYGFQHDDGSWGWWRHDDADAHMTAYVCFGLLKAKAAGLDVSDEVLDAGLKYLREKAFPSPFNVYVRSLAGEDVSDLFADLKIDSQRDAAYAVLAGDESLISRLNAKPPAHMSGKSVRTAALTLQALHKVKPDSPAIGRYIGWLLRHRRGARWVSTLDTAYVVYAFSRVADEPGKNHLRLSVNGRRIAKQAGRYTIDHQKLTQGENVVTVKGVEEGPVFVSARLHYLARAKDATGGGAIAIDRTFKRRTVDEDGEARFEPIAHVDDVAPGTVLMMEATVQSDGPLNRVMLELPLPAGCEPMPDRTALDRYAGGRLRDDVAGIALREVTAEPRTIRVPIRVTHRGAFRVLPASAHAMYAPRQRGWSNVATLAADQP
jgi:uncharacterized protein YfaS (alpha-2-macroglobulin family)